MFSVVIPLYNKEVSIKKTIQSVLNQTFQDFEIVVVNDGSTDNSKEVVEAFDDVRIRLIDKQNGGVSSARNRGIKEARYEWIAFLDGDDLWHADKLSESYNTILENKDVQWGFTGYYTIRKDKKFTYLYQKNGVLDDVINDLGKGIKIHTSTVVVKRELFLKYANLYFRDGLNNSEDREVWYKLCCIDFKPFYIRKILTFYDTEMDHESLVSLNKKNNYMNFLTMQERIKDYTNTLNPLGRKKLLQHIYSLNKRALLSRWDQSRDNSFLLEAYFSSLEIFIFKNIISYPRFVKKVILKYYG